MKKISKKKRIVLGSLGALVLLVAGLSFFLVMSTKRKDEELEKANTSHSMKGIGDNVISANGLTSVGMSEETLDFDFLETELYVEESFLSVGDKVEAGTVVFRVSDKTLAEARKELTNAVTEAQLSYRQGLLDYETESFQAKTTYETAEINQKYATAEYDSAVSMAASEVEELEEQIEDARELLEEYEKSINEDYYRSYYKVDELYSAYYEHFMLLMEKYEEWDIESLEGSQGNSMAVSNSTFSSGSSNMTDAGTASTAGTGNVSDSKLSVYNLLDEVVQKESQAYEDALDNYEKAKKQAEAGIDEARSNLTMLEAELVQAQTECEKELILCKADYDTTIAESKNASTVYDTTCQSLEEALEALQTDKEEAEKNLALFEEVLGDGNFYTQKAGTIVVNAVNKGSYLSGDTMVIAYSNPETVTITASVNQNDIAQIAIGDEALAVISEYGNYTGTVTTINPVTQANSRSTVTYQVTITLEGDVEKLESNLTAYVYFGVENIDQMQEEKTTTPDSREMPEGEERPVFGKEKGAENERAMDER